MPERLQRKLKKPVKYMEPKKVKIEKLPKSPWYKDPPIWIAIFALIATVVSLYLTREQYIKALVLLFGVPTVKINLDTRCPKQ